MSWQSLLSSQHLKEKQVGQFFSISPTTTSTYELNEHLSLLSLTPLLHQITISLSQNNRLLLFQLLPRNNKVQPAPTTLTHSLPVQANTMPLNPFATTVMVIAGVITAPLVVTGVAGALGMGVAGIAAAGIGGSVCATIQGIGAAGLSVVGMGVASATGDLLQE